MSTQDSGLPLPAIWPPPSPPQHFPADVPAPTLTQLPSEQTAKPLPVNDLPPNEPLDQPFSAGSSGATNGATLAEIPGVISDDETGPEVIEGEALAPEQPAGKDPKNGRFVKGNPWAMKPGETRNPSGKRKTQPLKEACEWLLPREVPESICKDLELPHGLTWAQLLVLAGFRHSIEGDSAFFKEIWARMEGKLGDDDDPGARPKDRLTELMHALRAPIPGV